MNNQELWGLLITGQQSPNTGFLGVFYAYGDHLGDVLEKVIIAAQKQNFYNNDLAEAAPVTSFEVIENRNELVEISAGVFMHPNLTKYKLPLDASDWNFVSPTGIVKSTDDTEYDYELIEEKFVALHNKETGIFSLELVLNKENLTPVFFELIDLLPAISLFYIYIHEHWDDNETELWGNEWLNTPQSIKDFLQQHRVDTLENGFLEIVVYSTEADTDLRIDDHKKIQFATRNEDTFRDIIGCLLDLGYEQTRDFYDLEFGYYHFHYRLANSLNRTQFKQMLIENQFQRLKERKRDSD